MDDVGARPKILIVEDEPNVRDALDAIVKAYLQPTLVLTAPDLQRARAVLATVVPTVILVDLRLPDGDGVSLVHEIRADCRLQHVRVLAMTAYDTADTRAAAKAAGCDAFLAKPFPATALVAAILGEPSRSTI